MSVIDMKLPPHSMEAEQAVLGGLLLDNTALDRIADLIVESDFYRQDHRQILNAIARLIGDSKPADVVTVAEMLQSLGELESVGGLPYIVSLASNTPSAANIRHYAGIVRERSFRREILAVSQRLADLAHEPALDQETRMATAMQEVMSLGEVAKTGREAKTLNQVILSALEAIDARIKNPGMVSGVSTGFTQLDDLLCGLQPGDLIIVAGRPSMGKTTLAQNVAENAVTDGKAVYFASLEMTSAQLGERILARFGNVPTQPMRKGQLDQWHYDGLVVASGKVHNKLMVVQDDSSAISSVARLRLDVLKAKRIMGGVNLIVVDYLQLMTAEGKTRNEELGSVTRALKLLAKELSCPVILLSQLSRKCEERSDKRPLMSDLRESGAIEQDADVILMAYRDEYYNPESPFKGFAEIICRKQRMGPLGTVHLRFEGQYSRFSDAEPNELARAAARAESPKQKTRRGFVD